MSLFLSKKVYLDYASGSFPEKSVFRDIGRVLRSNFGNTSSIHDAGSRGFGLLNESRSKIANTIGAHSKDIIFTSSATESIAIYLHGVVMESRAFYEKPHIITSTIEHSAILKNCELLEKNNLIEATYLKPDTKEGLISADSIVKSIKENTVLVTIHAVNSELGTQQDIASYIKALNSYKEKKYNLKNMRFVNKPYYPYLHIDAVQAYVHADLKPLVLKGIDAMSFNSVKIGGPAGVGVLYLRVNTQIRPLYSGGSQEFGLRPGTVNLHDIYAFSNVAEKRAFEIGKLEEKYSLLKKEFISGLDILSKKNNFDFIQNSTDFSVPSIISISFPYFTGQQMAVELNARGVFVSSKSACNTGDAGESYVVSELRNISDEKTYNNYGTIRISFGPGTKKSDIKKLLKELEDIISTYKGVLY